MCSIKNPNNSDITIKIISNLHYIIDLNISMKLIPNI